MSDRFHQLPGFRWLVVVIAVIGALMPLPTILAPGGTLAERAVTYGPWLAVCLWMAFRVSRCGITQTDSALVIRNPLRTVVLPWSQIDDVELGRFGIMPKVGVRLHDGSAVGIFGLPIAGSARDADAGTLRLVEQLRRRAQQSGRSTSPSDS